MPELKTIEGIIQNIKSNRKSLAINGLWFNNFNLISEDLEKGDNVKITYSEKKLDNKVFNNIKSITKLKNITKENKCNTENTALKSKLISDSTINCLLMQSVQYSLNKNIGLDEATAYIINSYKEIINSI